MGLSSTGKTKEAVGGIGCNPEPAGWDPEDPEELAIRAADVMVKLSQLGFSFNLRSNH